VTRDTWPGVPVAAGVQPSYGALDRAAAMIDLEPETSATDAPRLGSPSTTARRPRRSDRRRADRRRTLGAVASVGLLVPICLVYLWFPQDSDGVLFELGARRLAAGAVFYRDLWDIKQPGIYWFYQAGLALGVGVVGPRLLEIAGALVGALAVRRLTARWDLHPGVEFLAPVLVVGTYLLLTHRGGVLVVEGLTVPLLVVVLAAAWPALPAGGDPRGPAGWAVAGLAAGCVGVLKLIYLPLPATLLLGALIASRTSAGGRAGRLLAAAAGAAVPLLATVAYFAAHGVLGLAWTTTFRIPLESVSSSDRETAYGNWVEMGVELSTLLVPLTLVALATVRRRRTLVRELTVLLVVLEIVVLAFQQYATPYRFLVVVAPMGVLAVVGADVVWRRLTAPGSRAGVRVVALLAAAVLALPLARGPQRLLFAAKDVPAWGLGRAQRDARDIVLTSAHTADDVEPVRGLVRPGEAIYVFGQPQLYTELGTYEALEITGWAATLMPERVWRERDRELVRSRPRLVFVDASIADAVRDHSPGFTAMLAASYRRVGSTPGGTWYRTDRPGVPAGVPGDNRLTTTAP